MLVYSTWDFEMPLARWQLCRNATRDKRSFIAYAAPLSFHTEEAGFLACEGTSRYEVGQPVLKPTPRGGFCRPWRHPEPQPQWWHPWSYRSTRARPVKSRKSFPSSRRLPARQLSAKPFSRRYLLRSASP